MSLAQILGIFSQFQVAGLIGRDKAPDVSQTLLDEGGLATEETSVTQCIWQRSRISSFILFVVLVTFFAMINIWIRWG